MKFDYLTKTYAESMYKICVRFIMLNDIFHPEIIVVCQPVFKSGMNLMRTLTTMR